MCGRYFFNLEEDVESTFIKGMIKNSSISQFNQGEIFPSEEILIIEKEEGGLCVKKLMWGKKIHNQLLINARSETVDEKFMFQKMKRCVIPCNYFFEWKQQGKQKVKYQIAKQQHEIVYLAGLCDTEFVVILTGEASENMRDIHHRTPLLLNHSQMIGYLNHELKASVDNQNLTIKALIQHEQVSLF